MNMLGAIAKVHRSPAKRTKLVWGSGWGFAKNPTLGFEWSFVHAGLRKKPELRTFNRFLGGWVGGGVE